MSKKKFQFNKDNIERERFSNFVVDLRQLENKIVPVMKKEEKKISKKMLVEYQKLNKRFQEIKPNLLSSNQTHQFFSWGSFDVKILQKKITSIFRTAANQIFSLNFNNRPKILNNHWRKFVREQKKIFQSVPPIKALLQHQSAQSKRAERLERAESTALWYRSLFSFALVLILIILPFKLLSHFELFDLSGFEAKIKGRSQLALNNLLAAADSISRQDFKDADSQFQKAGLNFLAAADDLNKINDSLLSLAALSGNSQIKIAAESKKFLTAGAIASSLGRNLVLATDSLFNNQQNNFSDNLDKFLLYGYQATSDARELKKIIAQINSDNLPAEYQTKFVAVRDQAASLADNLDNFVSLADKLKGILGVSQDKRYLVVFQNNSELRASGGFLGSYALIDFREGQIRNLEVPGGGSYDTEGGLKVRVAAPQPLWLVNTLWHFWDANWWPDWPSTARNLMWFYEKSDGPSVDGVISVTPTVVERLLEITGPIDLTKEYGLIIDADNFWETTQKITEQSSLTKTHPTVVENLPATSTPIIASVPLKQGLENNSENKPKKIIGDLLVKILEVLPSKLDKDNLAKILMIFENNMSEKQILLYFTDPALQAAVSERNWAGEIKETAKDYLMVVNTNIAGQKSDRLINEQIEETSEVSPDGTIINTLKITRTHNGIKRTALTGVRNVDWLRVYVPAGSILLSASGFQSPDPEYLQDRPDTGMESSPLLAAENSATVDPLTGTKIYSENNKTVFANWTIVDPGQSATIILSYRLPFNFFDQKINNGWWERFNSFLNPEADKLLPYSLLVQKQPGAAASNFQSNLILPNNFNIFWRYPENLEGVKGWNIVDQLDADKYWSILVQKNN